MAERRRPDLARSRQPNLNLRTIKAIGYDMDYTLVGYQAAQWEERAYAYLKAFLVEAGWDTPEIRALEFDAERVMRGLIVDQELGNLLKVNRFAYVKQKRHGLEPIAFDRYAAYGTSIDLTRTIRPARHPLLAE